MLISKKKIIFFLITNQHFVYSFAMHFLATKMHRQQENNELSYSQMSFMANSLIPMFVFNNYQNYIYSLEYPSEFTKNAFKFASRRKKKIV